MRLVREWQGKIHIVTISDTGAVEWNGQTWRSLSEVARAVTLGPLPEGRGTVTATCVATTFVFQKTMPTPIGGRP